MHKYARGRCQPGLWQVSCAKGRRFLASFSKDESGTTMVLYVLTFSVLLLCGAMAVDYGRALHEKNDEQAALDAAVLAAAAEYSQSGDATAAEAVARKYFAENLKHDNGGKITYFGIDGSTGEIVARSGTDVETTLMKPFDVDSISVNANARAAIRKYDVEVALVLDNSEEMAGTPLEDLKEAADGLIDILYTGVENGSAVKVSVIPFAGSVNVGAQYAASSWMDDGTKNPTRHNEYLGYDAETKITRYQAFQKLGMSWTGCVEVRTSPYDVSDDAPDPSIPDTYFQPMFAPDEPDNVNTGNTLVSSYPNSYLTDYRTTTDGSCDKDGATCVSYNKKSGACKEWSTATVSPASKAQLRACKYESATPDLSKPGPLHNCDSNALTPLTGNKSIVSTALNNMAASGNANIAEGVMWGLRTLSPTVPFTEGADYSDASVKKYMIILARGANSITVIDHDDLNKSEYTPWGYSANGRLNPQSTQQTALTNAMDQNSRSACRAVSDEGIKVYSIGFGASSAQTRSMLQYCATNPNMNYETDSGDELKSLFETIAKDILSIRLSS